MIVCTLINFLSTKNIVSIASRQYLALHQILRRTKNRVVPAGTWVLGRRVIPMMFFVVCFFTQVAGQTDTTLTAQDTTVGADSATTTIPISKDALTTSVKFDALDTMWFAIREKKMYLYKQAVVEYGDMKLEADFIEVDFNTNEIHASGLPDSSGKMIGEPIFTTEGKPFHAEEMWYNFKTKKGISKGVVTSEEGGIIRGEKILKDSINHMYIRGATYTTCNAEHPHFWISASKFKVIPEKQVISGPANLVIAGINTPIVIPFGFFPIQQQRSRGLIIGSLDQQDRWGYGLRDFGFYTPLGDNLDMLIGGDIYLRGSWGLSLKSNYKKRYKYNGHVLFKFNRFLEGEKETPEFSVVDNVRVEWLYKQDPKARPNSNFSADVRYITQNQQRYASTNVDEIIATTANSSVAYTTSFARKRVFLTSNARIVQNLATGDLDMELPQFTLNVQRLQPFKNLKGDRNKNKVLKNLGFTYNTAFRNNVRTQQDSIFQTSGRTIRLNPSFLEGVRNGVRHNANVSTSFSLFKYFNFSPSASFTDFWYFRTTNKSWENDSLVEEQVGGFSRAAAYNAGISVNTIIYGTKAFGDKSKLRAIRHVIRPTVGMNFTPNYQEQANSGYRFVQTDTAGTISPYSIYENGIYSGPIGTGSGALTFAINNNLEAKISTPRDTSNGGVKKVKLIESFNLSGNYNFFADSIKMSNIGISAFTTLFNKVRVNFSTRLDPYNFVYDSSFSRYTSVDRFAIQDGSLGQFTSGSIQLSTSLNPDALKRRPNTTDGEFMTGMDYFMDFSIPWDLTLNYSNSFNRAIGAEEATRDQTLMFNGNIKLTEYWKIGFRSGYSFTTGEPAITSIDFARDLHCWVFNFHWIPLGTFRQFNFELKVKAAMLKDLKLRRRDTWQNNTQF